MHRCVFALPLPLECSFKCSADKFLLVSDASATWYAQELGSLDSEECCDGRGWDAFCSILAGRQVQSVMWSLSWLRLL